MDSSILIDWLSVSGTFHNFDEMIDFLGLKNSYLDGKFQSCSPINMYDLGLTYRSEGKQSISLFLGQHKNYVEGSEFFGFINISGRGCRLLETYSVISFYELLSQVYELKGFNCSRIDIALDIKDSEYPITKFIKAYENDYYISSSRSDSIIKSKDNHGNKGTSIYFGKISSDVRINIYDKRAERGYNERELPDGWIRIELRLRHETALVFISRFLSGIPIGQLFFGVLSDKLRFLKPNKNDSNKRRWELAPWWKKLIKDSQAIHLDLPGITYDLGRWEQQFFLQCGSRLKMAFELYPPWSLKRYVDDNSSIKLNSDQKFLLDNRIPGLSWYEMPGGLSSS